MCASVTSSLSLARLPMRRCRNTFSLVYVFRALRCIDAPFCPPTLLVLLNLFLPLSAYTREKKEAEETHAGKRAKQGEKHSISFRTASFLVCYRHMCVCACVCLLCTCNGRGRLRLVFAPSRSESTRWPACASLFFLLFCSHLPCSC